MAKQGLERFECVFLHSVLGETVFGAISNRGRSYSNDLCLSLVRLETGVGAIRMICVCRWSDVKQGLARFQCLFLCVVQRETGVGLLGCSVFALGPARNRGWTYSEAIRTICVCHWSAVKQGWARFQCLFLCLVRRETGVGAIRRNCFCIVFVVGPA